MFKEQYIRDNEKLHAKETLLMEIKNKDAQRKGAEQKNHLTPRQAWVRYGAVAAAFVLIAGGIIGTVFANRSNSPAPGGTQTLSAAAESTAGDVVSVENYDDIYALIEQMQTSYDTGVVYDGAVQTEEAAIAGGAEVKAADSAATTAEAPVASANGSLDYSETNVQVKGVDEADIVKTDGNYIYYVANNQLNIIKPDGATTKLVSSTLLGASDAWWGYNSEMFLLGDRLMIITQGYNTVWVNDANGGYENNTDQTQAVIYDISNPAKPEEIISLGQSGSYVSSRMIGDFVYIVTSQYVYSPVRDTPVTYIPSLTTGKETSLLGAGDLYVSGSPQSAAYTVVGSINLKNGAKYASAKAVFGGTSQIYANAEHLLLAITEYVNDVSPIAPDKDGKNVQITTGQSNTNLILLGLNEGDITKIASGTVPGYLLNQFSMDEYKGVFRVVTTVDTWKQYIYTDGVDTYDYESSNWNNLYTLDSSLTMLGKIENLAKDETVQSVRFDGDIGYFVTFRQVDPLFAVDLSSAKSPRILSTLKIPGFSEYLQTFGTNLLLGLGYDADEQTGATRGVKLTMFDTSNKASVKELFTQAVDADWTIAGNNHKAILADPEKNLIAFPADTDYYIFRYDAATGFTQVAKVDLSSDLSSWNLRGLFIGDNFYVVSES
ncbi:MAG TPA: beta-propeller domain-containing protein, partial [Candidatus Cryosericum sp.]|nr:beta-propeller domain-containing protein [Candidatus Cryosericum sp.]